MMKRSIVQSLLIKRKISTGICNVSDVLHTKQLVYESFGDPSKVLELRAAIVDTTRIGGEQVLIRWIASPINPADINQIQGTYEAKPNEFPAVAGNEGCGIVCKIGTKVGTLKLGDMVIPITTCAGTWSEYGVYSHKHLYPIDKELPRGVAAMLKVNPPSAYRMLTDFVKLESGDTVVQNGANSAVGQNVIQMCKIRRLNSINIVRDRPNIDKLKSKLYELGATEVFTEDEFAKIVRDKNNAKLALNCVGGKNSLLISRALENRGCMVTYGGMSRMPVQAMTTAFIFGDITLRGFWMSRWAQKVENSEELHKMYTEITEWYKQGALKAVDYKENRLDDYLEAINNQEGSKQVFIP